MQILSLNHSKERIDSARRAQAQHHRQRRVYGLHNNDPNLKNWRYLPKNSDPIEVVPFSGCHFFLYTARIALGTPDKQVFDVLLDTATPDLWVASNRCEGCHEFTGTRYDETMSKTFQVPFPKNKDFTAVTNSFVHSNAYVGDDMIAKGELAQDVLQLRNFVIPDQVFGQALSVPFDSGTCGSIDGVLGLGKSASGRKYASVMENIASLSEKPVISFYFNADIDDYERKNRRVHEEYELSEMNQSMMDDLAIQEMEEANMMDDFDIEEMQEENAMSGPAEDEGLVHIPAPVTANSELVLGGVNQDHYTDCLVWHDLISLDDSLLDQYWALTFDSLAIGKKEISKQESAVIDSSLVSIVGPKEPVIHFLQANQAKCSRVPDGANEFPVECDDPAGFDWVDVACDVRFQPVVFSSNGIDYVLDYDVLVQPTYPEENICRIDIYASDNMNHWVLGMPFLKKYYTAIDMANEKIGFAIAAHEGEPRDFCEADAPLDVSQMEEFKYGAIDKSMVNLGASKTSTESAGGSSLNVYVFASIAAVAFVMVVGFLIKRRKTESYGTVSRDLEMRAVTDDWDDYDYDEEM